MDLQTFKASYADLKNADKITILCDHESHDGDRNRVVSKQAAERNIRKNNDERFVCRECTLKYDNPMSRPRERRQTDDLVTVSCPHPEHKGQRERQIKKSAWFGPVDGPFVSVCKSCAQLGKEVSEEQRKAVSEKLTGRVLSDEHKEKILEYRKNNPEWAAKSAQNLIPGMGGIARKGLPMPEEWKEAISRGTKGIKKSEKHKRAIAEGRKKMLEKTGGFTREHRENLSRATLHQYARGFKPHTFHLKGWHESPKAGNIFFNSSYEKRAYMKLDEDDTVATYRRESVQVPYFHPAKAITSNYILDIVVEYVNGSTKWIEVKPAAWLMDEVVQAKAEAAEALAVTMPNTSYEFWTEVNLFGSVYNPAIVNGFVDKLKNELSGSTGAEDKRRAANRERTLKHYNKVIKNNKVTVYCAYCKCEHSPLRLTYDRNVARNGRYICEAEGGSIAGKKPKVHLRKENPYAAQGMKECVGPCGQVKPFSEFGADKSRSDGYSSRCKTCRSEEAARKYNEKKQS